jgi:hypothetical protein
MKFLNVKTGGNKQFKMYDISERELGTAVTSKESKYPSKAHVINDNENTKSFIYKHIYISDHFCFLYR